MIVGAVWVGETEVESFVVVLELLGVRVMLRDVVLVRELVLLCNAVVEDRVVVDNCVLLRTLNVEDPTVLSVELDRVVLTTTLD